MTEIMFEMFGVPAMHVAVGPKLPLYDSERATAVGLYILENPSSFSISFSSNLSIFSILARYLSHTVPIYEGHSIPLAVHTLDLTGTNLTNALHRVGTHSPQLLNRTLFVTFRRGLRISSSIEKSHELPDGQVNSTGTELFHCPEVRFHLTPTFQTSLNSMEALGIYEITNDLIMKCKEKLFQVLLNEMSCCRGHFLRKSFHVLVKKKRKQDNCGGNPRSFIPAEYTCVVAINTVATSASFLDFLCSSSSPRRSDELLLLLRRNQRMAMLRTKAQMSAQRRMMRIIAALAPKSFEFEQLISYAPCFQVASTVTLSWVRNLLPMHRLTKGTALCGVLVNQIFHRLSSYHLDTPRQHMIFRVFIQETEILGAWVLALVVVSKSEEEWIS
ncbi:hypothetical protein SADUNF_Sadunf16G0297400 [Salix dunnii]|uniref:Uncharacterized protein n=1 Tax=Salix dunnii TaxID=1413687 RepID=A0A835JCW3_9ROSI|nr:hypothetical protein SADUNF_Sadunf16G0297400 [Salix dunnii]